MKGVKYFNDMYDVINQNLYSAPSRSILGGAPETGQAEKNSLKKVVVLRTGTVWEVPKIYWKSIPGYVVTSHDMST